MSSTALPATPDTRIPIWRQFRWNMIFFFVVLAVVPVLIVATVIVVRQFTQTTQQVTSQLQSVADLKAAQITSWLQEADETLIVMLADVDHRYDPLVDIATTETPDEQVLLQLDSDLSEIAGASSLFDQLFFYDTGGTVLVASDERQIGKIVTSQPYFDSSLQDNYIQPPFYEIGTNELTIIVTRLIRDPNGNIVGAFAGRVNLDTLGEIMATEASLGETGKTYLISQQNNYLLTPSEFEGYEQTRAYRSEGIDRALAGETGAGIYGDYRDPQVSVLGFYVWVPELEAALLAEVDEAEALAGAIQARNTSLVLAGFAATLAALVGFVYAGYLSGPISVLTDVVTRIAAGDLTQRAEVRTQNEIGLLSRSVNNMTIQLRDTIDDERAARREAQEASRAKDLFLATMSHELRTPLNAIIGFLGLMLFSEQLDEDNHHMAERSLANSERLLNLINNILDLSRISAGNLEITPVIMSPAHLLEAIRDDMAFQFKERELDFQLEMDPDLPAEIVHDEERLIQIATNLLGNALKFTDEGLISLALHRDQDRMILTVSDTGIGIPRAKQQMIFDEFAQVDSSSTRSHGGAGLGLAIVKRLAILMKGGVTVTSETGKGSAFTVTLPLNLRHVEEEQALPLPVMQ